MKESGIGNYSKCVKRMGADNRLLTSHISLITAMFVCWEHSGFVIPFQITRRKLMAYSRIGSIATYHRCISDLDEFGYIRYQPSYHPLRGSLIWWPAGMSGP